MRKEHRLVVLGSLAVFLLDIASKMFVAGRLALGESWPVIPGIFHLTHLKNTGAAFSMFHDHPEVLTVIAGTMLVGFSTYMLTRQHLTSKEVWGFSFVLGGALGNLLDRLREGAVTDFLDVVAIHYPVFNLADSFIFMGVILLLVNYVTQHSQTSGS